MNNIERKDVQEAGIQGLLDRYLASRRKIKSSVGETSHHLDEDSLAAFAEGTMSKRESVPVVSHLVDCGFCRHKTAELVLLDLELSAKDEITDRASTTEPSSISRVLSGLLSKIFGPTDQAVFAHSEEEGDEKEKTQETKQDDEE